MHITTKKSSKKVLLAMAVLLIAGLGAFAAYKHSNSNNDVRRNQAGTSLERSEQELKETKDIQDDPKTTKQQTGSDSVPEPEMDSSTGSRNVNVVLTSTGTENGTVDASGFVSNLVEQGGSCFYSFTQSQKTITKTADTFVNPTSTTCSTVRFDEKELGPGEWKVSITYSSATATGTSNTGSLLIK